MDKKNQQSQKPSTAQPKQPQKSNPASTIKNPNHKKGA